MSGHGYVSHTNKLIEDMIDVAIGNEREDMWGEMPGKITAFYPDRQTADIQPLMMKGTPREPLKPPELLDVPVRFTRAGGAALTFPIKPGDMVTLRPQMRSSDIYHLDGGEDGYATGAGTSFGLSSMEAFLDGGESLTDPIPNFDPENAHMRFDPDGSFGIKGSATGKIAIQGSQGNVYKLLAQVVRLLAQDTLTIKYGSSAGSGHALQHQAAYAEIADKLEAMAL